MLRLKIKPKAPRTLRIVNNFNSDFDTLGSYTGVDKENPMEVPIQDADDL
ncbi:MAG: hypothetical protein IKZ38_02470 [Clostridia bacterium]|nr:hypothetical protein [Clostridia bacterium]